MSPKLTVWLALLAPLVAVMILTSGSQSCTGSALATRDGNDDLRDEIESLIKEQKWKEAASAIKKLRTKVSTEEKKELRTLLHRVDGETAWPKLEKGVKKAKAARSQLAKVDKFAKKFGDVEEISERLETLRKTVLSRIYYTIEDFEDGGDIDPDLILLDNSKYVKQGKRSARFRALGPDAFSILFQSDNPNWEPYKALVLWIYSEKKGARLTIDAVTGGDHYFECWSNIDWVGWKELRLPLRGKGSRFSRQAAPRWNEIRYLRLWKDKAKPIDIVLDDIRLER